MNFFEKVLILSYLLVFCMDKEMGCLCPTTRQREAGSIFPWPL